MRPLILYEKTEYWFYTIQIACESIRFFRRPEICMRFAGYYSTISSQIGQITDRWTRA